VPSHITSLPRWEKRTLVPAFSRHAGKYLMDRDRLVDAGEYLSRFGLTARSRLDAIIVMVPDGNVLLEPKRCRHLGLIVDELVTAAVGQPCLDDQEGKVWIELTFERRFVHCAVSDNNSVMTRQTPVRAHDLAGGLSGRIGHWFDDQGTSFVVSFPFTNREQQANKSAS
jgi:two-component sensor histidine kinase